MKHLLRLLVISMLTVGAVSAQQIAAPSGKAERGKALYLETGCYQCHGLAGQGAVMTGPRVSRTEMPFDGFLNQLRHPVNQMPPYTTALLSDQDAADLFAYLRQMPAPRDPNSIPQLKVTR